MDKSALRKYVSTKLGMTKRDGSRHEHYHVADEGRNIELLNLLSISRGSGEVARNNQKGVADALFMSLTELDEATRCRYGPAVAYLGIGVQVLRKMRFRIELDPIVYGWNDSVVGCIPALIKVAERQKLRKRGEKDSIFLVKLDDEVRRQLADAEGTFRDMARALAAAIREHRGAS